MSSNDPRRSDSLTWRNAITKVLAEAREPLSYVDITSKILDEGLLDAKGARTPSLTVNRELNAPDKDNVFVKVERGIYGLKALGAMPKPVTTEDTKEEGFFQLVEAFGLLWRKDFVDWKGAKTEIVGAPERRKKQENDFGSDYGIYILYDGNRVPVYAGQTKELGTRLSSHALNDNLRSSWDYFSFFVINDEPAGVLKADKLLDALEGMIIESFNLQYNKQGGKWKNAKTLEYIQVPKTSGSD